MSAKTLLLSQRMQSVADRISQDAVLADVGCDHGYLSIWLCQTGKIKSAIAMDVNKGPLQKAEENVLKFGLKDRIQLRLSDGLMKLTAGEVDSVAIAGMGGGLTIRILKARPDVVEGLKELILEPQSDVDQVRLYLNAIGFSIVDEDMVLEDGKFYPIMRAVPSAVSDPGEKLSGEEGEQESETDAEALSLAQLRYGKLLLEKKHPILKLLLAHDRAQAEKILVNLEAHPTKKSRNRIAELKKELQCIDTALSCYEM